MNPLHGDLEIGEFFNNKFKRQHIESMNLKMLHSGPQKSNDKLITLKNMNQHVRVMQYAVRGPIVKRAAEIELELQNGVKKPFKQVIRANLGDAQALGQKPITFTRQVLSLVCCPQLIDTCDFKEDVKEKAKSILAGCKGNSSGSYTSSSGILGIRKHAAEFIQNRDGGIPCDPDNVILCAGATEGIRTFLKLFKNIGKNKKRPSIMVPIPQYPLYSATLAEYNIHQTGYYLNESKSWALDLIELERAIKLSREDYYPRAIVVINPGNPTGQVLTKKNIQDIIKFSYREKLVILADEVYQNNVYAESAEFYSFKKIMMEMGEPYNTMELASYFSASKGYMGECGLRGGFSEIINVDPDILAMFIKSASAKLCPTVIGQATIDCIVDSPKPGDPSYEIFIKEKTIILNSLKEKAKMVAETLNNIQGINCNTVQGAMYAFPQIDIPNKAVDAASLLDQHPDYLYATELLESTGICIVPGSGFDQLPGSYHFRTTILPSKELLAVMLKNIATFQAEFLKKYN